MYMRGGLVAVDERDDMRMMQALEDIDFGGKVVFQLLVKL